jgi:hypothetical protein
MSRGSPAQTTTRASGRPSGHRLTNPIPRPWPTHPALIPDEKPDRADAKIVEYLYHLAEQVREDKEKYNARVRKRVNGILKFAAKETITEWGKELARNLPREYGGKSAQAFFYEWYNGRGHLVHGNVEDGKRPSV